MQTRGLYVNRDAWVLAITECKRQMLDSQVLARRLLSGLEHLDLFGESSLNLNSPQEVNKALLKAKEPEKAQEALGKYREAAKLVQTYGDNFIETIHPETWRIHAQFEPSGTSTGRVSCHSPNLQNLPSDKRFQACLVAPPGKKIVQADYSACELRILADFSGEPVFLKAFEQDLDLHAQVAKELFGDVKFRPQAKAINFGIIYGMGAKSLALSLSVSVYEAERLLNHYFQKHVAIKRYLNSCVESAYALGYAQTRLGRRLYLDTKQDISRIAKNMPIQGTAAEICKLAMIRIHKRLSHEFQEAFLVNMIHDELVVECLEQDVKAIGQVLCQEMELAQRKITPKVKPKAELT
ncbi:MAG: DNA polymerase A family protein [Myxococcaceae bacterium]